MEQCGKHSRKAERILRLSVAASLPCIDVLRAGSDEVVVGLFESWAAGVHNWQLQQDERKNSIVEPNLRCSKCDGRMEEGFIADRTDDSRFAVSDWVEGKPEKSFWTGVKTGDRVKMQIITFRCTSCGYLEMYAAR